MYDVDIKIAHTYKISMGRILINTSLKTFRAVFRDI